MPDLPPTNPANHVDPDRTSAHGPDAASHDREDVGPGTVIAGKYKLLEPIGEGGMGAVWLAQQFEPVKRQVAIKLIRAGMDSKTILARFEAERQALSMMDHPNIARVLDAGTTDSGRPFFAMELVKGTPITEFCDERKLTPRQRLELFVPVCLAIQHAHQKGIIHRDIKPSNVLVALHDDKPVPKVIDFGVAKATGFTLTEKTLHTGFEQVVGTPVYMSPEQATFNQLDIDTRSDVYSLGVLLYELLTGTTPIERERFKKAAFLEMLRVVREEEPPRPSARLSCTQTKASIAAQRGTEPVRLSKELRAELDWVVMKSLEKDRTRRYSTAVNFAEDVQRYLAGEAVQAHPPSAGYRVRKFMRRHRGPVVAASLILLALIGGVVGTVFGVIKADGEATANGLRVEAENARDGEKDARGVAEKALDGEKKAKAEVRFLNYAHAVDLAHREYQAGNIARAEELLESCPADLRGWEWRYVHRLCHGEITLLAGHKAEVNSAVFSSDGRRILTAANDNNARVWDAETGKELARLEGHTDGIRSATFSADSRRIITASKDMTARIWDAESGKELVRLQGHTKRVDSAAFSADGHRIVTASEDNTARVWNAETGKEAARLEGHTYNLNSAKFSADGRRIVTSSADRTARIWDTETGKELARLTGHTFGIWSAVFSADGRHILTASGDKTSRVWDAKTGKELIRLQGHAADLATAEYSRDGRHIVTASLDNTSRVWDAGTGKELARLEGHVSAVWSAVFSLDGRRIVTASGDQTARVWDAQTGKELAILKGHAHAVTSAVFSADGRRVLTGSADTTARVWDAEARTSLARLQGHASGVNFATFSKDSRFVVTASSDRTARIWDTETGKEVVRLQGHRFAITSAVFSHDDRRIATASEDNTARVWDGATGQELALLEGHKNSIASAAFSADGHRVVTASWDNSARVWDAESGKELSQLNGMNDETEKLLVTTKGRFAVFSPDGRRVVTPSDNSALIWDAGSGNERVRLEGHSNAVLSAVFSVDGSRVVTTSVDQTARIWDAETGKELARLQGHTQAIRSAMFSPNGRRVLTASDDRTARLWDESGKESARLTGFTDTIRITAFSADGTRVLTASLDRAIRVWDAESGKLMLTLLGHTGPFLRAEFGSDDQVIRTAGLADDNGREPIRVLLFDTRSARATFRKYLEAPPPRPVR